MPTGLRLLGASRDLAPLYGSKICRGMIQLVTFQNGVGWVKETLTV